MTVVEEYRAAVQRIRPNARLKVRRDDDGYRMYRIMDGDELIAEDGGIIAAWRHAEYVLLNP